MGMIRWRDREKKEASPGVGSVKGPFGQLEKGQRNQRCGCWDLWNMGVILLLLLLDEEDHSDRVLLLSSSNQLLQGSSSEIQIGSLNCHASADFNCLLPSPPPTTPLIILLSSVFFCHPYLHLPTFVSLTPLSCSLLYLDTCTYLIDYICGVRRSIVSCVLKFLGFHACTIDVWFLVSDLLKIESSSNLRNSVHWDSCSSAFLTSESL